MRLHRGATLLLGLLPLWVIAGCDDGTEEVSTATGGGDREADDGGEATAAPGQVRVQLEPVEGVFIEGFEVGLRFETGAGEVIASTLWSDFAASTGDEGIDAFYDSVLSQEVPTGSVRVSAEVNVGAGPGPSVPDLSGPLPCVLDLDVAPEEVVTVEVSFGGGSDCLRLLDGSTPTTEAPTSSTTGPAPAPAADLAVGTSHHVDVDLECQAFELGGAIWSLVDGDPSSWQPAGERHEGGTFTIEAPGRGRFVGDAAETKVAMFERLPEGAEPACRPEPRP